MYIIIIIVAHGLCTTLADHPDTQSTVQTTRLCPSAKPRSTWRLRGKRPILDQTGEYENYQQMNLERNI